MPEPHLIDPGSPAGAADRGFSVRLAGPDDAEAWVHTHVEALSAAYAELMPAEFVTHHRARIPSMIWDRTAQFSQQHQPGSRPFRRAWIAEDRIGPLAVAEAGHGSTDWELARGFPAASTDLELQTLYTLPRGLGTGVGQALLDIAVADQPAYLWIMAGNPRAEAFYRRNGFVPDGLESRAGPTWHDRPMFRMHRVARTAFGTAG